MLGIVLLLAVLATLLVVVAVSQPVAVRLKVAPVVLLAVIGVAIGAVSIVLVRTPLSERFGDFAGLFANLPVGAETFITSFSPCSSSRARSPSTSGGCSRTRRRFSCWR